MRRRALLSTAATVLISGCASVTPSGNETTTANPTTYIDDPNLEISFETLDSECLQSTENLSEQNKAEFTVEPSEKQVTVEGWIADGDSRRTAVLRDASYVVEDTELRLDVGTVDSDSAEDCPNRIEYRIRITYKMDEFESYSVYHNGRAVESVDVGGD
ncbi:hypothetical protein [Halobacterium noricense]|uniref:hypothetical protein n=1 Tax=Halobacterium noricense TaxID=223182 RepID=UPI001E3FD716|nr:hypothetical protein [Halobacterium noricense]UHH24843.1 hypothetical protein LT974_12745 [Halobacterium noricense]